MAKVVEQRPIPFHAGVSVPGLGFVGVSAGRGIPPHTGLSTRDLAIILGFYVLLFRPDIVNRFLSGVATASSGVATTISSTATALAPTQNLARATGMR